MASYVIYSRFVTLRSFCMVPTYYGSLGKARTERQRPSEDYQGS